MEGLYVLLGLIVLFFTQRMLGKQISRLVHRLGGGQNSVVWFWSVLFLPGTLIHEVSHFLTAAALGTHTGKVEIFPEFIDGELEPGEARSVRLGSVQVAKMNPLQGFLIGFAPLITGSLLLVWLSTLIGPSFQNKQYLILFLQIYLFFVVANSFFPSKEDTKHAIPFIVLILLGLAGAWYLGLRFSIESNSKITEVLNSLSAAFFISFGINTLFILILSLINKLLRR